MSISAVITLGYGQGAQFIPTLGYLPGAELPAPEGGAFYPPNKRKKSRRVEQETDERLELENLISDIYDRIHGLTKPEQEEIKEIVIANRKDPEKPPPAIPQLDFGTLLADIQAMKRLEQIRQRVLEEEEATLLILMMAI